MYGLNTVEENSSLLLGYLDTVNELRDEASIRLSLYHQTIARSYNQNIRIKTLQVGDMDLRKLFPNKKEVSAGKLGTSWEGPYLIDFIYGQEAYRLNC